MAAGRDLCQDETKCFSMLQEIGRAQARAIQCPGPPASRRFTLAPPHRRDRGRPWAFSKAKAGETPADRAAAIAPQETMVWTCEGDGCWQISERDNMQDRTPTGFLIMIPALLSLPLLAVSCGRPVHSTTVEEYSILLYLGRHFGITNMLPLILPAR
jgi:hypothetical protein